MESKKNEAREAQSHNSNADATATSVWHGLSARLKSEGPDVLAIGLQLLLVVIALAQLDMLTSAFRRVVYLAAVCFPIGHFLPRTQRLKFFAAVCVAALFLVLGGTPGKVWDPTLAFVRTVPLLLAGGVLIGICLLPVAFWSRVALLAVAGGIIALFRTNVIPIEPLLVVWPLLASLFMFRLMIFLYDVSTAKVRPKLSEILAYFYLFPNTTSTLFPLVDFKTMCRSHYDSDAFDIYRRGIRWILRGVLQLLVYRLIQQLAGIDPQAVTNGTELIQFVLASTFVYVQVSGYFHLVIGLLLLFGFNLPETNRRYFLASSFTEYWRRVNIYWKDFIVKVFYYPAYFRLKSRGPLLALTLATLWSFFITWVLHLYQTWWLKGAAPLGWPDVLFWSILAVLVLANSIWEMKRGRQRKLASSTYDVRSALGLLLRTAGTFTCVAVLWSLWSSPTLTAWVDAWSHADRYTLVWGGAALLGIMVATLIFEVRPAAKPAAKPAANVEAPAFLRFGRSFAPHAAALALVLVASYPFTQNTFDRVAWQPWFDALNTGDSMMDQLVTRNRGYYERLTSVDEANRKLWETLRRQKLPPAYQGNDPVRPVNDFRFREPLPNVRLQAYETLFHTNSLGMRDREHSLVAPNGTARIAVLGSSHVMGWGVPYEETFVRRIEDPLNALSAREGLGARVELMNFAFYGLSPLGQLEVLRRRAVQFQPDVVLVVMHAIDYDWVNRDLPRSLRSGVPLENPYLQQVLRDARITPRTHEVIAERRMKAYERPVTAWAYQHLAREIREAGAIAVAVLLPIPSDLPIKPERFTALAEDATAAGFRVIDLSRVFEGAAPADVQIEDGHVNSHGHALIANALSRALATEAPVLEAIRLQAAPGAGITAFAGDESPFNTKRNEP